MPPGVATRACTSISSMFPYLALFMPLARVAIQPPNVENSMESGSMPIVTPYCCKASFNAMPVMPASMQATPSSMLTQSTWHKPRMSRETMGLGSASKDGQTVADVTLVRPPTGMTAKPSPSAAAWSTACTSSSDSGRTTASGIRCVVRVRSRQMSSRPWPVPARSRASASAWMRASGTTAVNLSRRPRAGGGSSGSGRSGNVSRTPRDTLNSFCINSHNWKRG
mmetsp:Transcript_121380/g.350463  ORF Transcript_121380/g.350463 Transcript_121380/m.350463 type:complete len:224 (+) Transcript_121380:1178-1849(+)